MIYGFIAVRNLIPEVAFVSMSSYRLFKSTYIDWIQHFV